MSSAAASSETMSTSQDNSPNEKRDASMLTPEDERFSMDRNLALEVVRVTEAAALSASLLVGRGDEKAADKAAVDAMRDSLNSLNINGE